MTFRSVLVPLDGSPFGEHALPMALSIASRAGARLDLVHVNVPLVIPGMYATVAGEVDQQARRQAQDYLEEVRQRVAAVSSVPAQVTLLEGQVADELLAHAMAAGTDLVVLTTHGRGALSRLWLGSVALELVRRMPMPLLLVRPPEDAPNGPVDLAAAPTVRRILIPLDGSPFAEQILEPAAAVGTLMEAECRLLRVVLPVTLGGHDLQRQGADFQFPLSEVQAEQEIIWDFLRRGRTDLPLPLSQMLETAARIYLGRIAEQLEEESLTVQTRVVFGVQPARAILDDTATHDVDLIALETHGRSGLSRLFLGSVADKVVRGAAVPVLLHRPVADDANVQDAN